MSSSEATQATQPDPMEVLKAKLAKSEARCLKLREAVQVLKLEGEKLVNVLDLLRTTQADLAETKAQLEEEQAGRAAERDTYRRSEAGWISKFASSSEASQADKASLASKVQQEQAERIKLQTEVDKLQQQLSSSSHEHAQLQAQLREAQQALRQEQAQHTEVQSQLRTLNQQLSNAGQEQASLKAQLAAAQQQLQHEQAVHQKLQGRYSSLQQQVSGGDQESSRLQAQLQAAQQEVQALQAELSSSKHQEAQMQVLQQQLQASHQELADVRSSAQAATQQAVEAAQQRHSQEVAAAAQQQAVLQQQQLAEQVVSVQAELSKAHKELQDAHAWATKLQESEAHMRELLAVERRQHAALQQEVLQLQQQLRQLQAQCRQQHLTTTLPQLDFPVTAGTQLPGADVAGLDMTVVATAEPQLYTRASAAGTPPAATPAAAANTGAAELQALQSQMASLTHLFRDLVSALDQQHRSKLMAVQLLQGDMPLNQLASYVADPPASGSPRQAGAVPHSLLGAHALDRLRCTLQQGQTQQRPSQHHLLHSSRQPHALPGAGRGLGPGNEPVGLDASEGSGPGVDHLDGNGSSALPINEPRINTRRLVRADDSTPEHSHMSASTSGRDQGGGELQESRLHTRDGTRDAHMVLWPPAQTYPAEHSSLGGAGAGERHASGEVCAGAGSRQQHVQGVSKAAAAAAPGHVNRQLPGPRSDVSGSGGGGGEMHQGQEQVQHDVPSPSPSPAPDACRQHRTKRPVDSAYDSSGLMGASQTLGPALQPGHRPASTQPTSTHEPSQPNEPPAAKRQRVQSAMERAGGHLQAVLLHMPPPPSDNKTGRSGRRGRPPKPRSGLELLEPILSMNVSNTRGSYTKAATAVVRRVGRAVAAALRSGACSLPGLLAAVQSTALSCATPLVTAAPYNHSSSTAADACKAGGSGSVSGRATAPAKSHCASKQQEGSCAGQDSGSSNTGAPACVGWGGWCKADDWARGVVLMLGQAMAVADAELLAPASAKAAAADTDPGSASQQPQQANAPKPLPHYLPSDGLLPSLYSHLTHLIFHSSHTSPHLPPAPSPDRPALSPSSTASIREGMEVHECLAGLLALPVPAQQQHQADQAGHEGEAGSVLAGGAALPLEVTEQCALVVLMAAAGQASNDLKVVRGMLHRLLTTHSPTNSPLQQQLLPPLCAAISVWPQVLLPPPVPFSPAAPPEGSSTGQEQEHHQHTVTPPDCLGLTLRAAIQQVCSQAIPPAPASDAASARHVSGAGVTASARSAAFDNSHGSSLTSTRSSLLAGSHVDDVTVAELAAALLRTLSMLPALGPDSQALPAPSEAGQQGQGSAWMAALGCTLAVVKHTLLHAEPGTLEPAVRAALLLQASQALEVAGQWLPGEMVVDRVLSVLLGWQPQLSAEGRVECMELAAGVCTAQLAQSRQWSSQARSLSTQTTACCLDMCDALAAVLRQPMSGGVNTGLPSQAYAHATAVVLTHLLGLLLMAPTPGQSQQLQLPLSSRQQQPVSEVGLRQRLQPVLCVFKSWVKDSAAILDSLPPVVASLLQQVA